MQRAKLLTRALSKSVKRRSSHRIDLPYASIFVAKGSNDIATNVPNNRTFHTDSKNARSALLQSETGEGILFPRESPGLNYALNWSLAGAGVTPSQEAYRNLKPEALKERGATVPAAKTGVLVLIKGTSGISNAQFNRLFKEVTSHISSSSTVFVHDGAVGSSSTSDVRTRLIADSPAAALSLAGILNKTPTRNLAADSFPLNVYSATGLGSEAFIAVDLSSSTVLIIGDAIGDTSAVKSALTAASEPLIVGRGALPLRGRLAKTGGKTVLFLAPPSMDGFAESAVSRDVGAVWNQTGVARLFATDKSKTEPNEYDSPMAVFLLTSDSTGALPLSSPLSPSQAAFHFLAATDGKSFFPAFKDEAAPEVALIYAQKFAEILTATGSPAYLVNVSKVKEQTKLIESVMKEDPKASKPAEAAVSALTAKLDQFIKSKFPELPEGISR